MMSDENNDEDFLDDDLEIEDLDDLSEDDDWDDFDDDDGDVSLDEPEQAAPAKSGERTFIQKYFYAIVGLFVLVVGGLFAWGQFGSTQAPQTPPVENVAASVPALEETEMPPMPAPMESVSEEIETAPAELEAVIEEPSLSAAEDTVLTPMPELDVAEAPAELPELTSLDNALPVLEEVSETADAVASEAEDVVETLPVPDDFIDELVGTEAAPEEAVVAELEPTPEIIEEPVLEEVIEEPLELEPTVSEGAIAANELALGSAQAAFDTQMAEKDQELEALKTEMGEELSTANDKINSLTGTIAELQAELTALKAAPAPKAEPPEEQKAPEPAAIESSKPAPKVVEKAAEVVTPKAKPVVQKPRWTLRSAQSGKAAIASVKTGDIRTIEIGDNVPGLGRIKSIAKKSGKWLVQGTQGSVSQ